MILRKATVERLLRETPSPLHEAVVAAASTDLARFSLTDVPLVRATGTDRTAASIAVALSAALEAAEVRVAPLWSLHPERRERERSRRSFEHDDDDDDDDHSHDHDEHWRLEWFVASAALSDGRWLNVEVAPPPDAPWGWTFVLSFVLSAAGIAVVAVLTGRRIAKPMRSLATAAGRLGRGEAVEDLPVAGPQETRDTVHAFNVMRERLDRFVRDRTAMLAAISHDLRTPITSLRLARRSR